MEMSAVVGVLVALPQSIQSAKELYDLRAKYKDASVLITAIYSESMVIAASLSQVQNLLQHDALREKPQLLETFDRALTGCRVVYGCLEEEVRELRVKAENDDLKFKYRARFLWKEDTFRELLTQIRGQQSALSLLIQGLQMESIADIKKLVEDNSVTLDQVVKRSRTLRQSHPRLKVPESLFSRRSLGDEGVDTDPIAKATEFAFDDEVVNSKAYRRAMAMALSSPSNGATVPESSHTDVLEDYSTALGSISEGDDKNKSVDAIDLAPPSAEEEKTITSVLQPEAEPELSSQVAAKDDHADLFDTLERDILSFMPQTSSTALCLTPNHTGSKNPSPLPSQPTDPLTPNHTGSENIDTSALATHLTNSLTPAPLRSFSGDKATHDSEAPPPLPPRRPSRQPVATPEMRSVSPDDSIFSSDPPSILSKVSTASSHTVYEVAQWNPNSTGQQLSRKPLSLVHKSSHHALGNIEFDAHEPHAQGTSLLLHNIEMNSIWRSLVDTERKFVDRMIKLKRMFYDNIIKQWPIIEKHLNAILVGEQLASLHQQCLLHTMDQELAGNGSALCNPHVFEVWVDKSQRLYREYCRTMPHASSSLRTTQNMDPKFSPFVNTLGLSLAYYGKSWQDYLELPGIQLQTYIDSLESLITIAETLRDPAASSEVARLRRALQAVTWLKTLTLALLEEAQGCEDVQNLEKRIRTDTNTLSQLHLHEPTRRVVRQGGMAMKIKSQGPWIPVHAVLLDNYFLWGRVKKSRGDEVLVTDPPVALADIGFFLPADAHQIQKATMLDQMARGSILYIVTLTNKAREGKPDLLGLYNIQDRKTWTDHFTTAWTKSRR